MSKRPDPIIIPATEPNHPHLAVFIFLHGFDDDAEPWAELVQRIQNAGLLPHVTWILPTAPHNHEAMARAWFTPSSLGPVRSSSGSTTDDEDPASSTDADVDIAKIRTSLSYINNLITTSITRHHIPASRVIVGGFSQGAVMSLLTGMLDLSKLKDMEGGGGGGEEGIEEVHYTGRLGGIAALSGYVALPHKLTSASPAPSPSPANTPTPSTPSPAPSPTPNPTQIFLAHGTKDMLVPMSLARRGKEQITELVGDQRVEWREYQGMGHVHCGAEMMDLCRWVGRVVKSDD